MIWSIRQSVHEMEWYCLSIVLIRMMMMWLYWDWYRFDYWSLVHFHRPKGCPMLICPVVLMFVFVSLKSCRQLIDVDLWRGGISVVVRRSSQLSSSFSCSSVSSSSSNERVVCRIQSKIKMREKFIFIHFTDSSYTACDQFVRLIVICIHSANFFRILKSMLWKKFCDHLLFVRILSPRIRQINRLFILNRL